MNVDKARHNLGYSPSFADAHQLFEDYKKEMETNRFGDFFQERYGSSAAYCQKGGWYVFKGAARATSISMLYF